MELLAKFLLHVLHFSEILTKLGVRIVLVIVGKNQKYKSFDLLKKNLKNENENENVNVNVYNNFIPYHLFHFFGDLRSTFANCPLIWIPHHYR